MTKEIMVLVGDYWHSAGSIEPIIPLVFGKDDKIIFTENPEEFYNCTPDVLMVFKDPIENDQIPTPVWCDDRWTETCISRIKDGMGFVGMHAGLTDLEEGHRMVKEVVRSTFVIHPEQCSVKFVPDKEHEVLAGIEEFEFPQRDEHYVMKFYEELDTKWLAHTESVHGTQAGVWVHQLEKGRICCITPAHSTENLTYAPFVQLMKNAVQWCVGKEK